MNAYQDRIKRAQKLLASRGLEAAVVASPPNFFYFSGTWLDSHERLQAIIIPKSGNPTMIVHEMSREEVQPPDGMATVLWKDGEQAIEILAKILPPQGTISIDNRWQSDKLLELMSLSNGRTFVKSTEVIEALRLSKDQTEIDLLSRSGAIADKVIGTTISFIKAGMTEKQVAAEMKRLFREEGVERLSFDPIIAVGKNGAIPHHQTDESVFSDGDMVVIDMGGIKDHYCSDMTRTVVIGEPTEEMVKVYGIVLQAHEEAIKAIKPGVTMRSIDATARGIIEKAGYGQYFTHRTGHGLGIEVHEEPYLTPTNGQLLEEGMVVSVEPGIYLNGKFGVRIEDIVVVTADGAKRFNHYPRELIKVS